MVPAAEAARYPNAASEEQVFDGLSGLIEVRGLTHDLPAALRGAAAAVSGVARRAGPRSGDRIVSRGIDSGAPTTRLVDGQYQPTLTIAPGQTQLWHIANIGADIFYRLSLAGSTFEVVAQDGHPVIHPNVQPTLVMPPGKRWDVLVTGAGQARPRDLADAAVRPGRRPLSARAAGDRRHPRRRRVDRCRRRARS